LHCRCLSHKSPLKLSHTSHKRRRPHRPTRTHPRCKGLPVVCWLSLLRVWALRKASEAAAESVLLVCQLIIICSSHCRKWGAFPPLAIHWAEGLASSTRYPTRRRRAVRISPSQTTSTTAWTSWPLLLRRTWICLWIAWTAAKQNYSPSVRALLAAALATLTTQGGTLAHCWSS